MAFREERRKLLLFHWFVQMKKVMARLLSSTSKLLAHFCSNCLSIFCPRILWYVDGFDSRQGPRFLPLFHARATLSNTPFLFPMMTGFKIYRLSFFIVLCTPDALNIADSSRIQDGCHNEPTVTLT